MSQPENFIAGVPEHLKPQATPSDQVKEGLSDAALSGGRFGRGVIEIPSEYVGPQAIRQAAQHGTLEAHGSGVYSLPSPSRSPESAPLSAKSDIRAKQVDQPVPTIMGGSENPLDL